MTAVWTQEADARLRDYLASHELVAGIGTEESRRRMRKASWRRSDGP